VTTGSDKIAAREGGIVQEASDKQDLVTLTRDEAERIGDVLNVVLRTLQVLSDHPELPESLRGSLSEIAGNTAHGVSYARKILDLDNTYVH
jgi:hypothetical protein